MPSNLVKNTIQEKYWEKAKEIVANEYGKHRMPWALVVSIYEKMLARHKKNN